MLLFLQSMQTIYFPHKKRLKFTYLQAYVAIVTLTRVPISLTGIPIESLTEVPCGIFLLDSNYEMNNIIMNYTYTYIEGN